MPAPIRSANFVIDFSPAAALAAGATENVAFTCNRPLDIYEATVLPLATVGGSTCQVSRQALGTGSFNTVTNAMAMATISTVARTTTVTVAERQCVDRDVIRGIFIDGGAGGANGHCYLNVICTPISGNT